MIEDSLEFFIRETKRGKSNSIKPLEDHIDDFSCQFTA